MINTIFLATGIEYYVLAGVSLVIIFSYLFDALARKTKFPSVILLLALGVGLRAVADYFDYTVDYINDVIPILGKVALILIVLEGALELEINKGKLKMISKSFLAALIVMLLCTFSLTLMFHLWFDVSFNLSLLVAVPLSIISSAVAIPSAASLTNASKEFIVYESTFSDIIGIILFTFVATQIQAAEPFSPIAFGALFFELFIVIIVSIVVTFMLFELIENISHKVKFFLILSILILSYVIATQFGLSALIIVFFFGLFLSNANVLMPRFLRKYVSIKKAEEDLHEFHLLSAETTFFIRTFFFLFFGFSISLDMFADVWNYIYGFAILAVILVTRFLYFFVVSRKSINPLAYITPRGLISILLFIQVTGFVTNPKFSTANQAELGDLVTNHINEKVLLIVILGSMFVMLFGTLGKEGRKKALENVFSLDSIRNSGDEDDALESPSEVNHSDYMPGNGTKQEE